MKQELDLQQQPTSSDQSCSKLPPTPASPRTHITVDVMPPDLQNPPPFTVYEAEFFESGDGDIISHDHHLNEDGEALYRFLLSHSETRPTYVLYCGGSHQETRTRLVTRTENGRSVTRSESYTVTITDFDFYIDLTGNIVTGPVHWSYADSEPAYRGLMVRQVEAPQGRRKATKEEINAFKTWEYTRKENGQPPWIGHDGRDTLQADKSSYNLRQLADEYAASPKILKELVYEKVVHGWDISKLEQAIRGAIAETQYRGSVNVAFQLSSTRICIRPDNKLSRLLSRTFYKVLLCIFLIYPFIWLFKRYHSRGGGRWEIYGGAYALKHIEPLSTDELENTIPDMEPPSLRPRIISTELGPTRIIGLREGEWFKEWEPIIKRSVAIGLERSEPMRQTQDGPISPAHALDGYTPPRLEGY